ncbi:anaerobic C4-dicarboxylate transporter family protein [Geobacter sp. SVR]|uniref:anaerobic C4-dicarboxylate transporter family protein n=1 Tax=Geobacter sp. SVR TaxID=2495594 RepID=UPI001950D314|nr:anaerobic C4-dicarboxylate transporter [Geobacter sp. SVR]
MKIVLEFCVVLAAIFIGSRAGGVGLGLWGGVGIFVLTTFFGLAPTAPPVDVILIILAVVMAASVMEAAGGIDYLVGIAERIIRRNPRQITIVAPLVSYFFTFGAGTGHIFYPLLPIMYEVAYENGIRPERPMAVSSIASQQAITASPVSAATAAMIALFAPLGIGLPTIMAISMGGTLAGVIVAALVQTRVGVPLAEDPEYQRRLLAGEVQPPAGLGGEVLKRELPPGARLSALLFLGGAAFIVVSGLFPSLIPKVPVSGRMTTIPMPLCIQIIMLSIGAVSLLITDAPVAKVVKTDVAQSGLTAVIGIFGLAWLGDTFIKGNEAVIIGGIGDICKHYPILFAFGLFFASVLLFSQAATTRALMPLGIGLAISPAFLIAMWPAVNGYFFLPTYGTIIAAINFDRSGTTRIGRFVFNHSFMLPGLIATTVAVLAGIGIALAFR